MGLSTSVKVSGNLASKIARMIAVSQAMEFKASSIVRESAFAVTLRAKNLVPVSTGALFASINPTFFNSGLAAIIGSHLPYAARQEFDASLNHDVRKSRTRTRNTIAGLKGSIIKGTNQSNPNATWGFLRKALASEKANFLSKMKALVSELGGALES